MHVQRSAVVVHWQRQTAGSFFSAHHRLVSLCAARQQQPFTDSRGRGISLHHHRNTASSLMPIRSASPPYSLHQIIAAENRTCMSGPSLNLSAGLLSQFGKLGTVKQWSPTPLFKNSFELEVQIGRHARHLASADAVEAMTIMMIVRVQFLGGRRRRSCSMRAASGAALNVGFNVIDLESCAFAGFSVSSASRRRRQRRRPRRLSSSASGSAARVRSRRPDRDDLPVEDLVPRSVRSYRVPRIRGRERGICGTP